ncbi:MAG: tRNA (5-methylaminomethyl-2-thiouridine)(34)-methyltransferase MnmD [Microcoleaceae cyanobacterium]
MSQPDRLKLHPTDDGSFTFFSANFNEYFHSYAGAKQEAIVKFVEPLQLVEKAMQPELGLLDVCYGLGYNTAAALEAIWAVNPRCQIHWYGLELETIVPETAIAHNLLNSYSEPIPQLLTQVAAGNALKAERFQGQLLLGDARKMIQLVMQSGFRADAIFLDPFSPPTCPQLWTVEFIDLLAQLLKPAGRIATYSCAAAVRTALMTADLKIGASSPFGRRTPGTIASLLDEALPPLSQSEQEHLQTRAAVPYRDPQLRDSAVEIHQRRRQEQQGRTDLEPTSQWKKRWIETWINPQELPPEKS